jgi:2-phospho-L-lactate guanylyltransferase
VTSWTIVIPVKGTATAKSRLGGSAELARAIALDTVEAACGVAGARVIVVTSSRASRDFVALGAIVVADPGSGLNSAVGAGIAAAGDGPVAVLLGDVPGMRSFELEEALALALAGEHSLVMVADADDTGTVLLAARNPADHRPQFGVGSRAAHGAAGYVELAIPAMSGLRRDVDTADQLAALGTRVGWRTAAVIGRE